MRADQVPYKGFKVLDWGDGFSIKLAVAFANHFCVGTFVGRDTPNPSRWRLGPEHTKYRFGGCGSSDAMYVNISFSAPDGGCCAGLSYHCKGSVTTHPIAEWPSLVSAELTGFPETIGFAERWPWVHENVIAGPRQLGVGLCQSASHAGTSGD